MTSGSDHPDDRNSDGKPEIGPSAGSAHAASGAPPPHDSDRASRSREARQSDKRGGPGHNVLLLLILMLPALKLAWTVGEGSATRDVVTAMGPANWPDVILGMMLGDAPFATLLAIVVSRISFAYFAAHGAVPRGDDRISRARVVGLSLATPLAFGVLIGVFFGPWWGLTTAVAAVLLRYGVIVEYRAGRRGRHPERRAQSPAPWRRAASFGQAAALVLTVVVLPVVALADALDGRSWAPVVHCSVDYGRGPAPARLIELDRVGNGVVGWDVDAREIANGLDCAADDNDVIREPWWRDRLR
ncbi:hypothetical protein [Embleya sp. NPDC020630]|uniref:hypothetical protein n=1 Tax=Embleya sp. NPDC020630 TaxID=3363979 RepID=UPI00378B330E